MDSRRSLLLRLHIDPQLLSGALILCGLGLVVLYSAGDQSVDVVMRQSIRMSIGMVTMILVAQISPARLARWAPFFYVVGIVLLVAVFLFGTGRGAQRWLHLGVVQFQPSEIMKIAVPVTVAWYLFDKVLPPNLRTTIVALPLVLVPGFLIIEQPDLGTALLVMAAGLFALFFAGISWRWILSAAACGLLAAPLAWFSNARLSAPANSYTVRPTAGPIGNRIPHHSGNYRRRLRRYFWEGLVERNPITS